MTFAERARVAEDPLDVTGSDHSSTVSCQGEGRPLKIHDVTLTLRPGMTTWGGEPGPEITPLRRIARGDTANVSTITFGDHTGTHVDPPVHFIDGGPTVDQLPLDALIGPCVVVEYDGAGHVSADWLGRRGVPADTKRILIKTSNSQLWNDQTQKFTRDFVAVDASAARWCVERGMRLVGVDYLTIEPQGPEKAGYPTHHTLLGAGVVIIEGLDLRGIAAGRYELICAPLKIAGGDGAPARVFLVER
jgi:arylformamidase